MSGWCCAKCGGSAVAHSDPDSACLWDPVDDDIIPTVQVRAAITLPNARIGREMVLLVPRPGIDPNAQARYAVRQLLAELEPVLTRELVNAINSHPNPGIQGD